MVYCGRVPCYKAYTLGNFKNNELWLSAKIHEEELSTTECLSLGNWKNRS